MDNSSTNDLFAPDSDEPGFGDTEDEHSIRALRLLMEQLESGQPG